MKRILIALSVASISAFFTSHSIASSLIIPNLKPVSVNPDPTLVKGAVDEFKNLSHHERKMMMKEVKKNIREYKKEKREGKDPSTNTLLMVLIAIILPPLAVYLHEGEINKKFWIDLLLTLLFYIPGLVYALIVILKKD